MHGWAATGVAAPLPTPSHCPPKRAALAPPPAKPGWRPSEVRKVLRCQRIDPLPAVLGAPPGQGQVTVSKKGFPVAIPPPAPNAVLATTRKFRRVAILSNLCVVYRGGESPTHGAPCNIRNTDAFCGGEGTES